MSSAKCATCNVQFENLNDMREHFQSDWHSHNVKLRVDGKKPVSKAAFRDAAHGEDDIGDEKPQFACTLCNKFFRSVQTLQSHVKSTEHLLKKEKRIIERDSQAASMLTTTSLGSAALGLHRRAARNNKKKKSFVDPLKPVCPVVPVEHREEDVTTRTCFFSGKISKDMETNLQHMKDVYSFTIPMPERCTNVTGLMEYLGRKINGCMCLVCGLDSKRFASLEAVRAHMQACNHQRIVLGPEYNEFYGNSLDDLEADVEKNEGEERDGSRELVVPETGKRVVKRRDAALGQKNRYETSAQMEERRMITAKKNESSALILKERRALMAPRLKEERKRDHKMAQQQWKWTMQMGVRSNMFHRKGYDGEGETN